MTGEETASSVRPELKGYRLGPAEPGGTATPAVPVSGDMLLGGRVGLDGFPRPGLSPALALVLSSDVTPATEAEALHLAIGGVFLALELSAGDPGTGRFVLGERLMPEPFEGSLSLYLDGRLLTDTPVGALGAPTERLASLAGEVGGLRAGQLVLLSAAASLQARPGTVELWGPGGSTLLARLDEVEDR